MTASLYLIFAFLLSAISTLVVFPWLLYVIMKSETVATLPKKERIVSFVASAVIMPCSIIGACVSTLIMLENSISDYVVKLSIQLLGACMVIFYLVSLLDDVFKVKRWIIRFMQFVVAVSFPLSHIYIKNLSGLFGIYELSYPVGSVLTVVFVLFLNEVVRLMCRSRHMAIVMLILILTSFCYMFMGWGLPVYYLGSVAVIGSMSSVLVYLACHRELRSGNIYLYNSAASFLSIFLAYLAVKTSMMPDTSTIHGQDAVALTMVMLFFPCADVVQSLTPSFLGRRHDLLSVNARKRLVYCRLKFLFHSEFVVSAVLLLVYALFLLLGIIMLSLEVNITWILLLDVLLFTGFVLQIPAPDTIVTDESSVKRIVFCDNTLWGLVNFRGDVIRYCVRQGYDVYLVAPEKEDRQMVIPVPDGVTFIPVAMGRTSTSPINDLRYFIALCKIYGRVRPHFCFHYTIKPNIYGSMAAYFYGAECSTAMIPGLGYVFNSNGLSAFIARILYRIGLMFTDYLLVLNEGNREIVLQKRLCSEQKIRLLTAGEGVNTTKYPFYDNSPVDPVTFTFVGRVLYDKGYDEFVKAAETVKKVHPEACFEIWGSLDPQFPNAVPLEKLQFDVGRGIIIYKGFTQNASDIYNRSGVVVVLPSFYHEGMNRSLMEACSTGKPIICTRIHGCMELVAEGGNGYTVPTRDAGALAAAMLRYISLSAEEKRKMCSMSRYLAESRFSIDAVIEEYKKILFQSTSAISFKQ